MYAYVIYCFYSFIHFRNYVFYLNDTTLEPIRTVHWRPEDDYTSCMTRKNIINKFCGNYIQFLKIYKDKILICGTNSFSPKYKIVSLKTLEPVEEKTSFDVCAAPHPDYPMVGEITRLGELISGTYTDISRRNSEIIGAYVTETPSIYRVPLRTNVRSLNRPDFISSVYKGDSVYIFFMENAIENNGVRTATVARLCQTDNGGAAFIDDKMWTTFRKARLSCKVKRGKTEYTFPNLGKFYIFYIFHLSYYNGYAHAPLSQKNKSNCGNVCVKT